MDSTETKGVPNIFFKLKLTCALAMMMVASEEVATIAVAYDTPRKPYFMASIGINTQVRPVHINMSLKVDFMWPVAFSKLVRLVLILAQAEL